MKTLNLIAALLFTAAISTMAHGAKTELGPKGGRLLAAKGVKGATHLEFFVAKNGALELTLLDKEKKPIAPGERTVAVTAGQRSAAKKFTVTAKGNDFVTTESLPKDGEVPVVIQISEGKGSPTNVRFTFANGTCGSCKKPEYVCVCHD